MLHKVYARCVLYGGYGSRSVDRFTGKISAVKRLLQKEIHARCVQYGGHGLESVRGESPRSRSGRKTSAVKRVLQY